MADLVTSSAVVGVGTAASVGSGSEAELSVHAQSAPPNPLRTSIISSKKNGGVKSTDELLKEVVMDDIRHSAKQLKSDFMGQMEVKLSQMMDDVVNSMEQTDLLLANKSMLSTTSGSSARMRDKRKSNEQGKLPEKEFRSRPSPLTELLQIAHFKTIHHIFVSTLALFMINTLIMDLLKTGSVDLGFESFVWAFGNPQLALGLLATMHFIATVVVYPCFYLWATQRQGVKAEQRTLLDRTCLAIFAVFMLLFIYLPASILWKHPLALAAGAAVTMEQCRLLMKMYAFVRHNAPRALKFPAGFARRASGTEESTLHPHHADADTHAHGTPAAAGGVDLRRRNGFTKIAAAVQAVDTFNNNNNNTRISGRRLSRFESWISFSWDDDHTPCPDYSKYLYYLFAPTLIYRDYYPRTNRVRWNFVCTNLGQCIGCIVYANFVVSRFCASYISQFGLVPINLTQLLEVIFSLMLPGILCLILGFFLLLHAWQNAFAEMLCFGDRLFYKDWWNCSSFASYYKTWNILVHDWLYTYVFKDAWECGLGDRWKALPTTLVFLISSIFHEYILSFSFNFFFPVLLTLFGGFGFAFVFIKNRQSAIGNIAMWMGLIAGTGIIFTFYGIEYFARKNCLPREITAWDFFKPRALSCDGAIIWSF